MTIEQTVVIPADHRLIIDVPYEIPAGKAVLTFTAAEAEPEYGTEPAPKICLPGGNDPAITVAIREARRKAANRKNKPISQYFGIISGDSYGDPVAYQRALRDEWDD